MKKRHLGLWVCIGALATVIWLAGGAVAAPPQPKIAASLNSFTLAITPGGSLWSWGYNNYGQLGLGDIPEYQRPSPTQVGNGQTWVAVSAGRSHSLGLKSDGSLWGWGYNFYYQLFGGPPDPKNVPTHMGTEYNDWVAVAAGGDFSLALRADGSLWSSGSNAGGECGLGYFSEKVVGPARVGSDTDWVFIAAGSGHSLAIKANGTLWAWGRDDNGQLGLGSDTSNRKDPTQVGTDSDWAAVSGSFNHSLGLKKDGSLWAWGNNQNGQLGVGEPLTARLTPTQVTAITNLKAVAAGAWFSLGVRTDGSLWAWGANVYGQLGLGDTDRRILPTRVGTAATWQAVAGGGFFSLGLEADNSLYAWGWNDHGQLGQGDFTERHIPTAVPGFLRKGLPWLNLLLVLDEDDN